MTTSGPCHFYHAVFQGFQEPSWPGYIEGGLGGGNHVQNNTDHNLPFPSGEGSY